LCDFPPLLFGPFRCEFSLILMRSQA
jgi:hypothetical protein